MNKFHAIIKYFLIMLVFCGLVGCKKQSLCHDLSLDGYFLSTLPDKDEKFGEIRIYKFGEETTDRYIEAIDVLSEEPYLVISDRQAIKTFFSSLEQGASEGRQKYAAHKSLVPIKGVIHMYCFTRNFEKYGYVKVFLYKADSGEIVGMLTPQDGTDSFFEVAAIKNILHLD